MAFAYLYEPEIQYQTKDGRNNTNGFLRVYLAATDDPATTYSDFNGTLNQQDIRLDDDGRAVVIVDNSKAYRLEVYDPEGTLLFTCSPVTAVGGGGGSGTNFVQVISSDGTVSVSSSTSAGTRYFDLSVAIDDNKPANWADRTGTATSITGDGEWHELGNWVDIGTTTYFNGWQMFTDAGYDVAGSLEMLSGDADALSSIDVRFLVTLDGVTQVEEFGRIDPTKDRDRVSFEWKQEGLDHQVVNARIFVRASEDMNVSLVSRACYNEEVNGIIGNGGAGGDFVAGEYIEIIGNLIQATGLQPLSGMSAYAYESSLSSKLDASASSQFYPTSNPSGFISDADISGKMDKSASSEFYPTSNPSGFVTGGPYVSESSYSSFSSEITDNISSISSIVSAISGQTGDFVEKSSISAESSKWNEVSGLSSKLDSSASSGFYPTSNPSGFISSADASTSFVYNSSYSSFSSETTSNFSSLSSIVSAISGQTGDFVEKSSISAESAKWNEVSGLSGKVDETAMSAWIPYSALEGEGGKVTGVSGSAFKGHEYTGISPVVVDNVEDTIAVEHRTLCVDSTMTAYNSGNSAVIGVNVAGLDLSSKMDASASSLFYPADNPSCFIDGASASAVASAYAESAASSKQDTLSFSYDDDKISAINGSALAGQGGGGGLVTAIGTSESGITSINNSGLVDTAALHSADYSSLYVQEPLYISASGDSSYIGISGDIGGIDSATCSAIASAYAESAASSKLDTTAQVVTSTGSASAMMMGGTSYYASQINGLNISAQKAYVADEWMHASDKLDTTAFNSGDFYSTSNPSSFVDSAYVESQVSSKQDTLTFDWDADSAISSINGSALAGQGGGAPIVVTGTAWDPDTSAWYYTASSNLSAAERHVWTFQNGNKSDYINYLKDDSGNRFPMMAAFLFAGAEQEYYGGANGNGRLQFSPSQSMFSADGSNKYGLTPLTWATGASMNLSAGYFRASYRGDTIFISRGPSGTIDSSNSSQIKAVRIEAHNSRGANISAYGANATGYYGDTAMKLSRTGVFVDDSGNSSNTAAYATLTTGSLTFYHADSSDVMRQSSIPYWNEKIDGSALGWLEVND